MMTNPKAQSPKPKSGHRSLVIGICVAGLLLRLAPLGRYVTPDEPAWVYRSIRFADALAARDWAAVPSTGHPGVTTMWLGALAVAVRRLLNPTESIAYLDWIRRLAWLAPENGEAFRHLDFFLPWGRVAVALVTTLGLVAVYPLLARLFDRRVALLAVGLLAFDPFLTGYSGLLHTDALLATFSLLALVAVLNGLKELCAHDTRNAGVSPPDATHQAHACTTGTRPKEPRCAIWWALSGLFTGLALLTKTPALILPPFVILLLAIRHLQSAIRHSQFAIRHCSLFIVHCSLLILLAVITYLALYPALWTEPASTLRTLSAFAGRHVETVQRPIFFAGQMTHDPGPAFYPAVFLFRASPVVLIGLAIGLVQLHRLPADRRFAFLTLLAFAILFSVVMSLGAKKHDRYLLPAFPPLTLAAALGWEYLGRQVVSRRVDEYRGRQTSSTPSSFPHLLIPLVQLALILPFIAYPLTYANPLAGGPRAAARVLSVDWGEGMGAAARWLNQLPDAGRLTVAALSVPSFAPLFTGHTVPLDRASLADYIVLGPIQLTNQSTNQPTHTVTLGFLDHAIVLTNTAPFEQADYLAAHVGPEDLILLDADAPLLHRYTGPGILVSVADLPDQDSVAARLAELSAGRFHLWLVSDPAASPITAAHLRRELETIATPIATATVVSAHIVQFTSIQHPVSSIQPPHLATFNDHLKLVDAILPATTVNAPFPIFLRWQIPAPIPADLHTSLYLRDSAGHLWAEVGQPVLNDVTFPTSAWAPGEWADNELTLKPPERIPPGSYAIEVTVADSDGAQLGAWDAGGQFQGVRVPLGDVEIDPPAEPLARSETGQSVVPCAEGQTLAAGPLLVCIPDLPPQAIPSGDTLTLALAWCAAAPPQADYRVRWQLLDTAGSMALEQATDLSPYATSRWREGDSFEARYDLRIDPALPAAVYTLALNVLAPDGRSLWAEDEVLTTVEVLPRDRSFELPAGIAHPLDLTLGDLVHLRGFDLTSPPSPPELGGTEGGLQPGDTLPLALYWQADGPTDLNYTVFVHLVGPDGQLHGQVDRPPAGGAAPTNSWAPGQVIVDEITLPIAANAPAGTYHIAVGMYDAASGGRLPVTDATGQPLPDDRAILPVEITIAGDQP